MPNGGCQAGNSRLGWEEGGRPKDASKGAGDAVEDRIQRFMFAFKRELHVNCGPIGSLGILVGLGTHGASCIRNTRSDTRSVYELSLGAPVGGAKHLIQKLGCWQFN